MESWRARISAPPYQSQLGQAVSETGDAFDDIAVFSLAVETTGSGSIVNGVMLSRSIPAVLAGSIAGVVLDRFEPPARGDLIRSGGRTRVRPRGDSACDCKP